MELFTVASCVATCLIGYAVLKITADMVRRHLLHKRLSKFGAPPSLPFIGSAHLFLGSTEETTMGVNLREKPDGNRYAETVEKVFKSAVERFFRPWLHPDFIFYRTRFGKNFQDNSKYLNDFADNVIRTERKKHLERGSQSDAADHEDEKSNRTPRRMTLLDHLLVMSCEHGTLSDRELRDEVNTMIIAGYDTLATATSFAMLALASNPEIQDEAYKELCEIYGEDDSREVLVTPEDLTRMHYLERVIKETLRLFPIVPLIPRAAEEDFDIGEMTVPKGSLIVLGIIELHRNENYWPDPMKFDPDRFLPDEVAQRHPFAYLPFGGGIRSCIGMKYTTMSMKTLLATVLRRYVLIKDDIVPVKDLRLKVQPLLGLLDPVMLRIERRLRNDPPS